jgi:hypothetical protein
MVGTVFEVILPLKNGNKMERFIYDYGYHIYASRWSTQILKAEIALEDCMTL